MRRGRGSAATVFRAAVEGVVVDDNNDCDKDDEDNHGKDNQDKYFFVVNFVNVVDQIPKKRQRLGSLFPTLEASRDAKNMRRRERRGELKSRVNDEKGGIGILASIYMVSTSTTTEMTAGNTALLSLSK